MQSSRMLPFLAVIATVLIGAEIEAAEPPASLASPRWKVVDPVGATPKTEVSKSLDRLVTLEDCLAAKLGRPLTDREKDAILVARKKTVSANNATRKAYWDFAARVSKIDLHLKPVDVLRATWPDSPCFESYLAPGWEVIVGFHVRGLELTESMTKQVLQEERRLQAEMVPVAYAWTLTISEATGLSMREVVEVRRTEEKIRNEQIKARSRELKTKSAK